MAAVSLRRRWSAQVSHGSRQWQQPADSGCLQQQRRRQQQRVALARALALKPQILLLDEVTSALDPELVNEVLDTVRKLAKEGMTMIIVSHEMAFVREVADKIVFMDAGQIIEAGRSTDILDNPQTDRARDFFSKILRR